MDSSNVLMQLALIRALKRIHNHEKECLYWYLNGESAAEAGEECSGVRVRPDLTW